MVAIFAHEGVSYESHECVPGESWFCKGSKMTFLDVCDMLEIWRCSKKKTLLGSTSD